MLQICDYLKYHNDKICLTFTCRRLAQLIPALGIKLPITVLRIKDLVARMSWPFFEDILFKEVHYIFCQGCQQPRVPQEWNWMGDQYPSLPMYHPKTREMIWDTRGRGYFRHPICRHCAYDTWAGVEGYLDNTCVPVM